MSKVVIFDWGGVVENHEENLKEINEAKVRLIKRYNNKLDDEYIINNWPISISNGKTINSINNEYELNEWFNLIKKNMNIDISIEEFKKAYQEEYQRISYYKDVVLYIHSLKNRVKIAILSNLMLFDKKRIDYQYDLSKFDYVYLSYELGLRKPDRKIYEYVLNDLKINPHEILFVDDDSDNIKVAKECGFQTCQACGYELDKIKESVEKFLSYN